MNHEEIKRIVHRHRGFFRFGTQVFNHLLWKNRLHARGTRLSQGVTVLNGLKIHSAGQDNRIILGDFVRMNNCRITILGSHNTVAIGDFSVLQQIEINMEDDHNLVEIGQHSSLCGRADLAAIEGTKIRIGDECLFSGDLHFRTGDSHSVLSLDGKRINPSRDIVIDNHVWIGTKVTCLKGVYVAPDCIVAATTTLCGRYPQNNSVIAGVPGKVVKTGVNWCVDRLEIG